MDATRFYYQNDCTKFFEVANPACFSFVLRSYIRTTGFDPAFWFLHASSDWAGLRFCVGISVGTDLVYVPDFYRHFVLIFYRRSTVSTLCLARIQITLRRMTALKNQSERYRQGSTRLGALHKKHCNLNRVQSNLSIAIGVPPTQPWHQTATKTVFCSQNKSRKRLATYLAIFWRWFSVVSATDRTTPRQLQAASLR